MRRPALLLFFILSAALAHAEELYCEVMTVEGRVTLTNGTVTEKLLQEGDLLQADDRVTVGASSYVDLAYDRDWNNITRIEENSTLRIRALLPAELELETGGVFAKLKSLPKDSSFDVRTPTAIASVRGSEYRTTHLEGETQVYNVADSDVYVYGLAASGDAEGEPVIVQNSQKTQIPRRGERPVAPQRMAEKDFAPAHRAREMIERKAFDNIAKGRMGKTRDVGQLERMHQERMQGRESGRQIPKTLSGDEAREAVDKMHSGEREGRPEAGPGQEPESSKRSGVLDSSRPERERSGALMAGEGIRQQRPEAFSGADRFEGRGLGEPYFPSDEKRRSGGPEPVGFPGNKWQTGPEAAGQDKDGRREAPGTLDRQPGQRPLEPGHPAQQTPRKGPQGQGKTQAKPAPRARQQR